MRDRAGAGRDGVTRIANCRLSTARASWTYALANAAAIDEHWRRRLAQSPRLFNGTIYLLRSMSINDGELAAEFSPAEFKSFLYWRESGYPECGARDGFGSALIRSAEGHVLLGKQSAGNINAGLAYLPGGFIDSRDVTADGAIDIDGSIARELAEETGLAPDALTRAPGYLVTTCGPLISIAIEFRAEESAEALRARMLAGLARDGEGELADVVVVRSLAEADPALVPPYARLLLEFVFRTRSHAR